MLLHDLISRSAARTPAADALQLRDEVCDYAKLDGEVRRFAGCLAALGVRRSDRVAVFLDKRFETVVGDVRRGGGPAVCLCR